MFQSNSRWGENLPLASLGLLTAGLGGCYWLGGFGLTSIGGEAAVFKFLSVFGMAFAFYGLSLVLLHQASDHFHPGWLIGWILGLAIVFRLFLLPAGISDGVTWEKCKADLTGSEVVYDRFLLYDHDVWRYLWDGHVQSVGMNPYGYAPAELEPGAGLVFETNPHLEAQLFPTDTWSDIWDNLNYKEIRTVYPPLLQVAFRLSHALAPGSVLVWKLILVVCDVGLCLVLLSLLKALNQPIWLLAGYAWNPLVIKEIAGSAHADVIPALMIALAVLGLVKQKPLWAGGWLAGGILAKLAPAVLIVLVWKRLGWLGLVVCGAVTAIGFLPFFLTGDSLFGGLGTYSQEWIFNPGFFELVRWLAMWLTPSINPSTVGKVIGGVCYLGLLVWLYRTQVNDSALDLVHTSLLAIGGILFFSSAVMPWYLVWVLPLALAGQRFAWVVYSALCLLSYWVYIRGDGVEEAWRLWLIHGGFVSIFIVEQRAGKRMKHSESCQTS